MLFKNRNGLVLWTLNVRGCKTIYNAELGSKGGRRRVNELNDVTGICC